MGPLALLALSHAEQVECLAVARVLDEEDAELMRRARPEPTEPQGVNWLQHRRGGSGPAALAHFLVEED